MVQVFTSRSIERSGGCEVGRSVGADTRIDNELAEVGGFWKVTEGDLVRKSSGEERVLG